MSFRCVDAIDVVSKKKVMVPCLEEPATTHHHGDGFVVDPDGGEAFWFLNTLTLNKLRASDTNGALSIVDHRVPAGFAPPPHIHHGMDEVFYVIDGSWHGFCGETTWTAGPGSLVFLPRDIPHGFHVDASAPGRALVMIAPGNFDEFVAALGDVADSLELPNPVPPDPERVVAIAAAHGIQILPPPQ
jgi:quercetin dioxygenase-like cupin family protein